MDYFEPEHYDIVLEVDKLAKKLTGKVIISGVSQKGLAKFHAKNLQIHKVNYPYDYTDDILTVRNLPTEKPAKIEINFTAPIQDQMHGAYFSHYKYKGKSKLIVATQFESHFAREAFPCIDEPAAKATFRLTLKHDQNDTVLSNTPVVKTAKLAQVSKTVFAKTPRMSTYLLAFVIGEFHLVTARNRHGVTVSTYAPLNQPKTCTSFANQIACDSLDFYTDKFDIPYPLPKLDQVCLPDFEAGAMENWGLVTYRESLLLVDDKSSIETKKSVALVIAHELSHQWFGNLVTMRWWDDLWLNESFATMIEYICIDALKPDWQVMDDFFLSERLAAMNRDSVAGVQTIRQAVNSPDEIQTLFDGAIVYAKGACLMYMLKAKLGDDNFYKGLHDYFKKHAYGNTTGDDLWQALQKHANFNVRGFMEQWLVQPNFPIIRSNGTQKAVAGDATWQIEDVHKDLSGYYLLDIDGDGIADLAVSSQSRPQSQQKRQEKMRLLLDANILTRTNNLPVAVLFDLLVGLSLDDDEVIWSLGIALLKNLRLFFEDDNQEFQQFIRQLLLPKLKAIGLEKSVQETTQTTELRTALLSWLLHAHDQNVTDFLLDKYNPELTQIDSSIRSFVLTAQLESDLEVFEHFLAEYKVTENPELKDDLGIALTGFKNEAKISQLLRALQDFETIRTQDTLSVFAGIIRNEKGRPLAWQFLTDNWSWFDEHFSGGKNLDYYPRIVASVFRTDDELNNFIKFMAPYKVRLELNRAITMGEVEIKTRLKLISDNREAVLARCRKMW